MKTITAIKTIMGDKAKFLVHLIFIAVIASCSSQDDEIHFPKAAEQNIDGTQLSVAFEKVAQVNNIRSLVVSRNEIIVAEEYYNGGSSNPDDVLHVMSVTKSITSTLVGIAIDQGFIESVNQTISDFLGDEVDTVNPELGKVTIEQLLTMTPGHDWRQINEVSEFPQWIGSPNQIEYILNKEIINPPGTVFDYSDGAAHLVSYIIQKSTEMKTYEFANQYLFEPMGIGTRDWYVDQQGIAVGGAGLIIGPHDMQKIGFLYLNDGLFNDKQIVSSSWINEVTSPKISTENTLSYLTDYGFYWWIGSSHGIDYVCALGYGGQFILVAKNERLVVTATCSYQVDAAQASNNWNNIFNIIINEVLPAIQ